MILYHKIQEGCVDLSFPHAADKVAVLSPIADWLSNLAGEIVVARATNQAGSLRIEVPKMVMTSAFEAVPQSDVNRCFQAIHLLAEFANMAAAAEELSKL